MKRFLVWMWLVLPILCASCATAPRQSGPAPDKVVVLGSRIPQSVNAKTQFPRTTSPVFIISRDQLDRTGQVELGAALAQWPFLGELFGH